MTATRPKQDTHARIPVLYARDLVILLSLANLCYIRVWEALLDSSYATSILAHSPSRNLLLAAMVNVLALTLMCMAATTALRNLAPYRGANLGRGVFIVALVVPVFEFCWVIRKKYIAVYAIMGKREMGIICLVAAVLLTVAVSRWYSRTARWAGFVLIGFSPLVVLTFGQDLARLAAGGDPLADPPPVPLNANPPRHPRVLWFVFDEWDYRFTFRARPADLRLPEIDRFASTAISAANAIPPASETIMSVPMLLSGERYGDQRLAARDRFEVVPLDGPSKFESWASRGLIFSEARALGFNTAVAGWYLPYCRLLSTQLNGCTWLPMNRPENSFRDDTLMHAAVDETRSLFESTSLSPFGSSLAAVGHIETYRRLLNASIRFATDPRYNLVFSHLPVPHYPYTYDRATQTLGRKVSFEPQDYFNGLALLDRTLGELRRALEASGQWDDSVILLSTDHYFRWARALDGKFHTRVPFLLKLPHQDHAVVYNDHFNTITSKPLLLAVLRGEIQTPEQVVAWLSRNAVDCPTLGSPSE